jgi:hypothetical protein
MGRAVPRRIEHRREPPIMRLEAWFRRTDSWQTNGWQTDGWKTNGWKTNGWQTDGWR